MLSDQAFGIVKRFLKDFDDQTVTLVLRSIQDRVATKCLPYNIIHPPPLVDRKLIQTGFVLQLLLEVFRIELANRFKLLS
jgi:hypothetical protein